MEDKPMNARQIIAIVLIAAGALGLIYRGFSYTHDTHEARVGSVELSVSHRDRVDVPMWASIAGLVVGVGLLVARPKA
jgi:TRAP-type C4-dicarboxylate transport system permease small subunit